MKTGEMRARAVKYGIGKRGIVLKGREVGRGIGGMWMWWKVVFEGERKVE